MPAISVILTTYNKPQDLVRSLEAFRQQTFTDFEVLVCDDGSGPETKAALEAFQAEASFPIQHCWQEDTGFRAARSRNNGGRAAQGETLVFCDGDCVPLPDYLAKHLAAQSPDAFQAGERYMLTEEESQAVTRASIASGESFANAPARELKRVKAVRRKDSFYRLAGLKPNRPRLMTSNCSMPRAQYLAVNGLDQRYEGWGQEDEDLRRRLVMRGFAPRSVIGDANCLHLWHRVDKTFLGSRRASPNWRYYERGFELSRCRYGLVERPLSDVSARVVGPEPLAAQAREALGLGGEPAPGSPLEVEVLLDAGDGPPRASGEAEVTILLSQEAPTPSRTGAQIVFAPGAPVAGGELPTQELPEVEPALKKVGVCALRPLPATLGSDAFVAVREALEDLL